jgi:citrate lyase subunit beta/citryl-CoA lyase
MLRSQVLLNVRAAHVRHPISGTWGLIDDLDGLEHFATQTKSLGYEGMMAIHPAQVPIINQVFSPSAADIDRWRETIAAMEEARTRGIGAVRVRGRLVDEAHVKSAHVGLRYAEELGLADAARTSSEVQ